MKTIATLALIMALLGLPAVNATADTFTLWQYFPPTTNGVPYGFGTAGVTHDPDVLTPLNNSGPYVFGRDGVLVGRSDTEPLILMIPSASETAVLYGVPPETDMINVSGQFVLGAGSTSAHVEVGIALITDPSHPVYTSLLNGGNGIDLTLGNPMATFDLMNIIVDPTHALVFAVDQGTGDAAAYLQGTIEATTVPVPASLLLLGSGLLGLGGWRRLRKS